MTTEEGRESWEGPRKNRLQEEANNQRKFEKDGGRMTGVGGKRKKKNNLDCEWAIQMKWGRENCKKTKKHDPKGGTNNKRIEYSEGII